jgi:hypothetical protein
MYRVTKARFLKLKPSSSKWQKAYTVRVLRAIQAIIIEALPDDRDEKEKARLALLAAKESYFSGQKNNEYERASQNKKENEEHNKSHLEFERVAQELYSMSSDDPYAWDRIRIGAVKAGITIEQFRDAIRQAVLSYPELYDIPKMESKNPPTSTGLHDVAVGRLLVSNGINRKAAARVIAKLREKEPSLGAYPNSDKAKFVVDIDKETRSIEQRLRNNDIG